MTGYSSLAAFYDGIMPAVDYELWLECCDGLFAACGAKTVIDLACGTGRLSWMMAERGYEVIGVDASAEMLTVAQSKSGSLKVSEPPMFIQQSLEELDLYGTVDAAVCSMDGINYLSPDALDKALRRLGLFLEKNGVFIFDINTPRKFEKIDGCAFIDESDGAYCAWNADYDKEKEICLFEMDIFLREGKLWRREAEEHTEHVYRVGQMKKKLAGAGFSDIEVFGGLPLRQPEPNADRLFFVCRNGKK